MRHLLFVVFGLLVCFALLSIEAFAQPCTSRTTAEHDISTWRSARVYYDNDFTGGTNRYYTSGLRAEYITPACFYVWTSRLLFRWGLRSRTFYGFSVSHKLFTPELLTAEYKTANDRPFAGKIEGSHFMISNLREERMRFLTEIQVGLLGPFAGGQFLAQGDSLWQDQIKLDILLGYRARLEKGLIEGNGFDLHAFGEAQANTGLTYASLGTGIRLGRLNPPYYDLDFALRSLQGMRPIHDVQFFLFGNAQARFVAYDATLRGGLLNRSSKYMIEGSEVRRAILQASVGAMFLYKRIGVGYEHFFLTPQFDNGNAHNYGQFKLLVAF